MVEKASKHGPLQIRDALSDEVDEVSAIMLAAYSEYASSLTPAGWDSYASNITDVRGRLGESQLIVAERNGAIVGAVTFYLTARGRR